MSCEQVNTEEGELGTMLGVDVRKGYLKLEYLEFSSLSPKEAARASRAEGALGWQGQKLVTYKEMSK